MWNDNRRIEMPTSFCPDEYERDLARQAASGVHTFTSEHRNKNREVMHALRASMPFQDINKTSDCDLIYRYLIARKWDVAAATQSLRDYLEWRQKERIDEIMMEVMDPQVEETAATFFGLDKEGLPIMWDAPNPKLMVQLLKNTDSRDAVLRAHYKKMESARYLSCHNGVDRITYVLDLSAISMGSVSTDLLGILKEMSRMDQLYFPEIMRRMLICNGGWAVSAIWKAMSPILDERVQSKIQFLKAAPSPVSLEAHVAHHHVHPRYGGKGLGLSEKHGTSLLDQLSEASTQRSRTRSPKQHVTSSGIQGEAIPQHVCHPDDDGYYSLSDDDAPAAAAAAATAVIGASEAVAMRHNSAPRNSSESTRPTSRVEADRRSESASDLSAATTVCGVVTSRPSAPSAPMKPMPRTVLAPGLRGDGIAVAIELQRHGKVVRGFYDSQLVGEGHENLILSFTPEAVVNAVLPGALNERVRMVSPSTLAHATPVPQSSSSSQTGSVGYSSSGWEGSDAVSPQSPASSSTSLAMGGLPSPTPSAGTPYTGSSRVLVGELLRESGHPIHTHLVVSDANRNAKFILMQRNFHKQIVIYQVVGDTKIHTSKTCKHTVLGEKAKMARCGERVEGCDARDWAVWGKVRVGNQEVRKYLAEKQGWTLLFYDTLASLPIQDLFCLAVGLMELWEE